jgi:hypothetical protein
MFYNVTVLFSGTSILLLIYFLKTFVWIVSEQPDVAKMALRMLAKFEKYWDTVHGLLSIASILDPRYKMKMIQFFFP